MSARNRKQSARDEAVTRRVERRFNRFREAPLPPELRSAENSQKTPQPLVQFTSCPPRLVDGCRTCVITEMLMLRRYFNVVVGIVC